MIAMPRIDGFTMHRDEPLPDRTEYLIGNFLPMTGVGLLVGKPGTGKSFLTIAMAAAIATGAPFLGQPVAASRHAESRSRRSAGGATMFFAGEGVETYPSRVEAAYLSLSAEHRERLAAFGLGDRLPLCWGCAYGLRDDAVFERFLEKAVEWTAHLSIYEPLDLRLIVVDTLPAVFGFRDENSAAEAQGAFNKLFRLSNATGAFVLAIMHPGKNKRSGDVRGSGVFEGSPDVILTAKMGAKDSRVLAVTKARSSTTQNASWAYTLAPIQLPNGEPLAYVDTVTRAAVPTSPATAVGSQMTRDASDVLLALRAAVRTAPITWVSSSGFAMAGADEEAIRAEMDRIKPASSANPRHRKDALRQSCKRGIERLLREKVIDTHDHRDGRLVYWHVGDNLAHNGLNDDG